MCQSEASRLTGNQVQLKLSFKNTLTKEKTYVIINSHLLLNCPDNVLPPIFIYINNKTNHFFFFSFQILAGLSHLRVPMSACTLRASKSSLPLKLWLEYPLKRRFGTRKLLMLHSTIKPNYKIAHALLSVVFPLSD